MKKIKNELVNHNSLNFRKWRTVNFIWLWVFLILNLFFLGSFINSSYSQGNEKILEAWELRINGKANEAKTLIETTLEMDSTNAMAFYELSRTLNYMGKHEQSKAAIQKAIDLEPDNVIYAYAWANNCFLQAYMKMHEGQGVKDDIKKTCNAFKKVLEIKPDYCIAMMNLVEIYGYLPPEEGGDKEKAKEYIEKLQKTDKYYGAKAQTVLMPMETNWVDYWNKYIADQGECLNSLKQLQAAYIFTDDIENAKKCVEKAISLDPDQNVRILDLARFHLMKVMQNREAAKEELPHAIKFLNEFIESKPEPIAPLKAWSYAKLANFEMFLGNKSKGEEYLKLAESTDKFFSRAFGVPGPAEFLPPNEINHHFGSFFSPF